MANYRTFAVTKSEKESGVVVFLVHECSSDTLTLLRKLAEEPGITITFNENTSEEPLATVKAYDAGMVEVMLEISEDEGNAFSFPEVVVERSRNTIKVSAGDGASAPKTPATSPPRFGPHNMGAPHTDRRSKRNDSRQPVRHDRRGEYPGGGGLAFAR